MSWESTAYRFEDGPFVATVTWLNHSWRWQVFDQSRHDRDGAVPCGLGHELEVKEAFWMAEGAIARAKGSMAKGSR